MSEIKNPFLDNNSLGKNKNSTHSTETSNTHHPSTERISENNNTFKENISDSKLNNSAATAQSKVFSEGNVMEIKKDSNLLKNIIIALIILLILTILGLVLWNFLNKNKVGSPVDNVTSVEPQEKTIIKTSNFEMSGDKFKASSVVVE